MNQAVKYLRPGARILKMRSLVHHKVAGKFLLCFLEEEKHPKPYVVWWQEKESKACFNGAYFRKLMEGEIEFMNRVRRAIDGVE